MNIGFFLVVVILIVILNFKTFEPLLTQQEKDHCFVEIPWKAYPNCNTTDALGNCTSCIWQIPNIDSRNQPFIPIKGGTDYTAGCMPNPDSNAWVPITGKVVFNSQPLYTSMASNTDQSLTCKPEAVTPMPSGSSVSKLAVTSYSTVGEGTGAFINPYTTYNIGCRIPLQTINNLVQSNAVTTLGDIQFPWNRVRSLADITGGIATKKFYGNYNPQ